MAKVFYFPETANSYRIAKIISLKIPDCELIKITSESSYTLIEDDVVGIVFPMYYYGFPEIVETFIKNIQRTNTSYVFVLVTRGVLLSGGVKKRLLRNLHPQISYFQHVTMGDSFNMDFWNYCSARDKEIRNKQFDVSVSKMAKSIRNRVIKKPFALMSFFMLIKRIWFRL